jgi:hypothetical protein
LIASSLLRTLPIETSELRIAGPRYLCTVVLLLCRIASFSVQIFCHLHCAISLSRAYPSYLSHILVRASSIEKKTFKQKRRNKRASKQ